MASDSASPVPENEGGDDAGTRVPIRAAWTFVILGFLPPAYEIVVGWPIRELHEFGDYVGGVTGSIWALAGLLFIYAAFRGQMAQLRVQQRELKETREELRGQREQMEVQNRQIARQNFESTFFHLLRLHHSIVQDIDLRGLPEKSESAYFPERSLDEEGAPEQLQGRDAFRELFSRYYWHYDRIHRQVIERKGDEQGIQVEYSEGKRYGAEKVDLTDEDYRDTIATSYAKFYAWHQGEVGHYFRNLYHIVKYVDGADLDDEEYRRSIASLVRAQLSSYELVLLFYNCLSDYGEKFKPLAEKYALFEQFPWGRVIDPRHRELYAPEAFGDDEQGPG